MLGEAQVDLLLDLVVAGLVTMNRSDIKTFFKTFDHRDRFSCDFLKMIVASLPSESGGNGHWELHWGPYEAAMKLLWSPMKSPIPVARLPMKDCRDLPAKRRKVISQIAGKKSVPAKNRRQLRTKDKAPMKLLGSPMNSARLP